MKSLINILIISISVIALALSGYAISNPQIIERFTERVVEVQNLGGDSDLFIGGQTYFLNQSVSSDGTSMTLSSFTIPQSGNNITDTDIGDIEYGTIEPGNSSRQEFISFTGITQNADGTATLTGLARGLAPVSPYTASTTYQFSHSGGVRFIISDSPSKWDNMASKDNDETITGQWTFNSLLPTSSLTATTAAQFVTKSLLDATTNQGAATSTETVGGISELATQIEMASSTDLGANQPLVLQAKYSTSTPQVRGIYNIISQTGGFLAQAWINLTEDFAFSGTNTHTGTNTFSGLFSSTATSTMATTTTTNLFANELGIGTATTTPNNLSVAGLTFTDTFSVTGTSTNVIAHGHEIITATSSGPTSAGAEATKTVDCALGRIIVGGGASNDVPDELWVSNSFPENNSRWSVTYQCWTGGGGCATNVMTAYAICVNP